VFVTYPYFKLPLQFDVRSTNWHSVEVFLRHSWFMASIEVSSGSEVSIRTFLISDPEDLIEIARNGAGGHLVGVSLVIAPSTYEDKQWRMVNIKRLGKLAGRDEEAAELVLTDEHGLHYTGFPLAQATIPDRPVVHLAQFD
jgi:hypothetical protein